LATLAAFAIEMLAPSLSAMLFEADTVTLPVCPEEPEFAAALILLPAPSTVSVPALTVTAPALPELEVLELIAPPFSTEACPETVTSTEPALPLEPVLAWLEIALSDPSSVRLAALTVTVPAAPAPEVEEVMAPPLWMSRVPALTVTVPALPDPAVLELITPLLNTEACPVTVTSTEPALPLEPLLA
jgi:hypothetical protein